MEVMVNKVLGYAGFAHSPHEAHEGWGGERLDHTLPHMLLQHTPSMWSYLGLS